MRRVTSPLFGGIVMVGLLVAFQWNMHRPIDFFQDPSRTSFASEEPPEFDQEGFPNGVLSRKPQSFFQLFRDEIDKDGLQERCARYSFQMAAPAGRNTPDNLSRRIFYGSLITEEPWELFDIVATETHGIFAGVVFVESNRTQSFYERPFKRANEYHTQKLKSMFGTPQLQIRKFINEDSKLRGLARENAQRQEILHGWKEMGMTVDDVGYIADADETFSRDFLRAIQDCPYIKDLDYENHHCRNVDAKIRGYTRVVETTPECITKDRSWFHPAMIIGNCIEEIGDPTKNIIAPRVEGFRREEGYGRDCNLKKYNESYGQIDGDKHPLFSAGDFRQLCGGRMHQRVLTPESNYSKYTAFHLHNFFADFQTTRNKYLTYGHPHKDAMTDPLEDMHDDLKLLVRCVLNQTDAPKGKNLPKKIETQNHQRHVGGMKASLPPWPIYFQDSDYRRRKHNLIQKLVMEDEGQRLDQLNLTEPERLVEMMIQEVREAKRLIWDRVSKIKALEKEFDLSAGTKEEQE